jgi:type IV pilus assembly protein PilM
LGWIGVDVGTHTVKLAQAARDGSGVRLHRAAVIQRPSTWSGDDGLAMEQPIPSVQEIRAALECGSFIGRDAICSLPMNVCQLRGLNLPPGTDQERRAMATDELAEEWADRKVAMEFDFWEMDPGQTEKNSDAFNVSVLATSRPWIAQVWRDCRQSGLSCWAIDGVPLAMARAVSLAGGPGSGRRALAVDWGYSNVTLCVVGDGRPLYTRRIHGCGFRKLLEVVRSVFGVSLDEAQYLMDAHGVADAESGPLADLQIQTAITDTISDITGEFVRQLKRTLQFLESQRRHLHPDEVWLMGGGASTRNIGGHFSQLLGQSVHICGAEGLHRPMGESLPQQATVFSTALALSALAWRAA